MANDPILTFDVVKYSTAKQQELMKMLNDNNVRISVNTIIRDAMQRYVPKKNGDLRDSSKVTPTTISWGNDKVKYAHYQWYGEVYGPNYPIIKQNVIVGWYSKRGVKKRPTGRKIGVPGNYKGWEFGYTTPETLDHWDYQYKLHLKDMTNDKIMNYLRWECVKRKLAKIFHR